MIEVDALRLRCVIGMGEEERRDRQDVVVTLRIGTDARPAAEADSLEAVWDYRATTKAIIAHVEASSYRTVEKLASEIARICVVEFGAPFTRVRVHKPAALRFSDAVGIVIERTPGDFASPRSESSEVRC